MADGGPTWAGGVPGPLSDVASAFLNENADEHLIEPDDIAASIAHVLALEDAGILTGVEARKLSRALRGLDGVLTDKDEDVHSAVERAVTRELGATGAKLHTGRSRNDLVATDLRLWMRRTSLQLAVAVVELCEVITERADETATMLAPGYTHLQRGQPVTVGHWLLAHGFAFERDVHRLLAAHDAADTSPLGAGALAGNTLGISPKVSAEALGFSRTFANSIDAVSDRDFMVDGAYAYAMTALHLSRLAEELVVWSSAEFGFIVPPDGSATGSSMMPQKRNPDVAEVARAESGKASGVLVDLLMTLKGLPLAYDRDLQATKRAMQPLLRAAVAVRAVTGMVRDVAFDEERLRAACDDDAMLATDLAEALVLEGVPFRQAHEAVGRVARAAARSGSSLADQVSDHPDALAPLSAERARALLDPEASIRRRKTPGGPSKASVGRQVRALGRATAKAHARIVEAQQRLPD